MAGYLLNGTIEVRLLTSLPASPTAPTQSELNAGTDLVGSATAEELIEITGWQKTTEAVPTGGYAGLSVGSLAGPSSYPASSLRWRADDTSETIFSAVAETTTLQWVSFAQQGHASGERATIFPVTISVREEGVARDTEAHSFRADFSLTPPYAATQAA